MTVDNSANKMNISATAVIGHIQYMAAFISFSETFNVSAS